MADVMVGELVSRFTTVSMFSGSFLMRGLVNGFVSCSILLGSSLISGSINGFVSCKMLSGSFFMNGSINGFVSRSTSFLSESWEISIVNGFVSCSLPRLAVLAEPSRKREVISGLTSWS